MASITGRMLATTIPLAKPKPKPKPSSWSGGAGGSALTVECSSRPQKKATAHHMKTRPKKTQPWDVRRKGPTRYPPLPPLPPDWTLVSSSSSEEDQPSPELEEGVTLVPSTAAT